MVAKTSSDLSKFLDLYITKALAVNADYLGYNLFPVFPTKNLNVNYKFLLNFLLLLIPIIILITGERSNFLKSLIIFLSNMLFR